MKHLVYTIIVVFFIACNNKNVKTGEIKGDPPNEKMCNILNIPDTILNRLNVGEVIQSNLDKKIKLSGEQLELLSDLNFTNDEVDMYFYGVFKVYEDVLASFIQVVGAYGERFYMVTTDCSTRKIDFIYLIDFDYFDIIEQDEDREIGLFLSKYFKIIDDTTISVYNITIEETKSLESGKIVKTQTDSLAFQYHLSKRGDIELFGKDSVRIVN